jgi:dipeptidyl aminopeptidase/acylaminoacyl peptidase
MIRSVVLGCLTLIGTQVAGQGTQADYDRANNLQSTFANKVLNESVTPGWIGGGSNFWYVEQLPGSKRRFVLVEPGKKSQRPLFDHSRLSTALGEKTKRKIDPNNLPFQRISVAPDLNSISFSFEGEWKLDLISYELSKAKFATNSGLKAFSPKEVTRSGGGGEQSQIRFLNQSAEKLKIFWLEDDGNPREYKVLSPGEEWSINTWETHYWLVTRMDGTKCAVYKPGITGGTAFLDGKVVEYQAPKPNDPNVSPDGNLRVQLKSSSIEIQNINLGTVQKVNVPTEAGWVRRYPLWSPDSKSIVFFEVLPEESRPLNIVQTIPPKGFQPVLTTRQYIKPGDRIDQLRVCWYRVGETSISRVPDEIFPNAWDINFVNWVGTSKALFHYNRRGHQTIQLVELDVATGKTRVLIDEQSKTFLDWTGKSFYRIINGGREAIWQSERSGYSHIYLFDLEKGQLKNAITSGSWVVRGIDQVDEQKRQIFFRAGGLDADQDPYQVHYCRVNFDGSGFTRLTTANGNHKITYSPNKEYLIDTYSRVDQAPVHEVRRVSDGGKVMDLIASNPEELIKAGFKMPKPLVAKGRDGKTDIYGHVYFPSNYDSSKRYPVVEAIYAGPHSAHVPKSFHTYNTAMMVAELGFIVVSIDGMGTSHRSKAFHDVCWKNIADAGFPDRKLWIKAAAEKIPSMDISRVGIFGTSAGGQNALHAIQLHSDLYRVAVADCGCYDNRMDKIWWNEQWMGWPIGPHYEEQSCRTLAPKTNGKLLLLLGEMDTNVDPASTYHVVDALIKANKDFDFVVIPNVGHGAVGHPYGKRKLQDFLVRHLLGVEPRR